MSEQLALLVRARALISQGWGQCAYQSFGRDGATHYCIRGALLAVDHPRYLYDRAIDTLVCALGRKLAEEHPSLLDYNDAPERTQAEVLELYDDAIRLCGPEAKGVQS